MAKYSNQAKSDKMHALMSENSSADEQITQILVNVGYGKSGPNQVAVSTDPALQDKAREVIAGKLILDAAPKALRIMIKILNGDKHVTRLQYDASKDVLSRAGFVPPKAAEQPGSPEGALSSRSQTQLRDFIERAQRELADRSKQVIDVAPDDATETDAKGAGLLD